MAIVEAARPVTGGVDTHLEVNVAAALDDIGGLLGVEEFATDAAGHRRLVKWLCSFGTVVRVGVEGTGSYGVGLAGTLRAAEIDEVEVDGPIAPPAGARASPTRSTPSRRPGRRCRDGPGERPRPATATSRPSGR